MCTVRDGTDPSATFVVKLALLRQCTDNRIEWRLKETLSACPHLLLRPRHMKGYSIPRLSSGAGKRGLWRVRDAVKAAVSSYRRHELLFRAGATFRRWLGGQIRGSRLPLALLCRSVRGRRHRGQHHLRGGAR